MVKSVQIGKNTHEAVYKDGVFVVDGIPFDGHHTLWSFSYEPYTYLKESELSGDEWRKGGYIRIFRNGVCVLEEFCRTPETAIMRIPGELIKCMDLDWDNVKVGKSLYYRDYPAVIRKILDNGYLILATEDGSEFPLWAFEKEDEQEAKNREWKTETKVHATENRIFWWRKN